MSTVYWSERAKEAVCLFGIGAGVLTQRPALESVRESDIAFDRVAIRVEGRSTIALAAETDDWSDLFDDEDFLAMMEAMGNEALADFRANGGLELP